MSTIDGKKFFANPSIIANFAKEKILTSIEHDFTNQYMPLIKLKEYPSHAWMVALVYSLIKNLDMYNALTRVVEEPKTAEDILEAKLQHIAPGILSAKLSIKGIDELTNLNMRSVFYGGDFKNEEGETVYTFDAHSTYDEKGMREVEKELSSYFIDAYEKELGDKVNA